MKRYSFYLPLLLAVALAGCKDPTKDSVTSGSTIGNTTISDSTYTNSGDFIEQWDAYTSGEMKVITLTWSSSSVSIDGSWTTHLLEGGYAQCDRQQSTRRAQR